MWIRQFIPVQKNDSIVVVQRCAEKALQEKEMQIITKLINQNNKEK